MPANRMQISATGKVAPLKELGRWSLWAGLGVCLIVGAALVLRRLAAPQLRPLDPVASIMVVVLGVSCAVTSRAMWRNLSTPREPTWSRWGKWLAPLLCLLLLGWAVSFPQLPLVTLGIIWLIIVGEEVFLLWRERKWLFPVQAGASATPTQQAVAAQPAIRELDSDTDDALPANATQSLVRTRTEDGTETITGTLRAFFIPGQRTSIVHVGFCPPFPTFPTIEFESTEGPEADIKLAQSLPHGARFDVRLKHVAEEPVVAELAFHATANGNQDVTE